MEHKILFYAQDDSFAGDVLGTFSNVWIGNYKADEFLVGWY